jgi:hypothetical protein
MRCNRWFVPAFVLLALARSAPSQEPACATRLTLTRPAAALAPVILASGYYGDHIVHIGDGGNEAVRLYGVRNVGYKFSVVSLACFHLWTWGGTYCVYEPVLDGDRLSDKYKPIAKSEAARLLGKNEDELVTPFWYRYPLGLLLFLAAFVVCVIYALAYRVRMSRKRDDSRKPDAA